MNTRMSTNTSANKGTNVNARMLTNNISQRCSSFFSPTLSIRKKESDLILFEFCVENNDTKRLWWVLRPRVVDVTSSGWVTPP